MQVALVDNTATLNESTYFVHGDILNTPQSITDAQQEIVWAGNYQPYGKVEENVSTIENNIRFLGQYEDKESGLVFNYFRDYDNSLGRYVESDPVGLSGGVNLYIYANSSPINEFDEEGLQSGARTGLRTSRATSRQLSLIRQRLGLERRIKELQNRQFDRGKLPGAIGNSVDQLNKEIERMRRLGSPLPQVCTKMNCPWDSNISVPIERAAMCEIPKPKLPELSPPRDFQHGCSCVEWKLDPSKF